MLDRKKLAKLLGMASSANDHEALAALRMANKLVSEAKTTWPEILTPGPAITVTVTPPRWAQGSTTEEAWDGVNVIRTRRS